MLDSIILGLSLIATLGLYILFNFAEKKLSLLDSPDVINALHVKDRVLIKNKKVKQPIPLHIMYIAVEKIADPTLSRSILKEIEDSLKATDEGAEFMLFRGIHLVRI